MRSMLGVGERFLRRLRRRGRVVWRALLLDVVVLMLLAVALLARLAESAEFAERAASLRWIARLPTESGERSGTDRSRPLSSSAPVAAAARTLGPPAANPRGGPVAAIESPAHDSSISKGAVND